ncbi:hypothetical protein AGMMS50239_12360 [Bacteroidia bacterium]|nr:hypothetical protein AGMMS50239_12360 [Bacteroidia bacterium]
MKEVDESGIEEIVIDARTKNVLPLDSIIDTIEYVKLATNDENLIGEISQILLTDSLIIVTDKEIAKSIYVFDSNGNFKNKIGQMGQGPAEYVEISHVAMVPNKDQIAIIDRPQKKVHYFNYLGNYEYSERFPFMLRYFEYFGTNKKAFDVTAMKDPSLKQYRENVLIVTNIENEVIYGACNDFYKEGQFSYTTNYSLRPFENKIYYSPDFSNIIYSVEDSMVTAKYHLNIIYNGMPPLYKDITNELFSNYSSRYFFFNGDYIELKDFTYINIYTPFGYPFVVYSHATKETVLSTEQGSHPFYRFFKGIAPKARYGDNTIVFEITAADITVWKEDLYKEEKNRKLLDDLYKDLTSDSNPVLFFCHLNVKNKKSKK